MSAEPIESSRHCAALDSLQDSIIVDRAQSRIKAQRRCNHSLMSGAML